MKSNLKYMALALAILIFAGASFEDILVDKKKQADNIEKDLLDARNQISSLTKGSIVIRNQIDSLESAIGAINNFLKSYENEIYLAPDEITKETNTIITLTKEVEKMQGSFRKKIISLYKHGEYYELELLLSSKTPNEYLRRNQYLQKFSQYRKKEQRDLRSKKYLLEEKKKMLTLSTSSQRFYVESKRNERALVESRLKDARSKLSAIDLQISRISYKVNRFESELNNVKNFINNFEIRKGSFKDTKFSRLNYESADLNTVKGNLNLPVDVGLIVSDFGNITDNATGNISFNNGIDLSIARGSKVYAIAGGIVSMVADAPFYGKVVIITHQNGYRSVYASMGEISVNAGDNIKLNQVIGKTGATLEGQTFHFELWINGTPLNPVEWLRF